MSVPGRASRARGVTLIEVLTALVVLAFGLAAIVALFLTSVQTSHVAVDQNAAALLIPQAIKQIEKEHRITAAIDPAHEGEYIETLNYSPMGDTTSPYDITVAAFVKPVPTTVSLADGFADGDGAGNFGFWPHEKDDPLLVAGTPYRFRYRLERFPGESATDANRWYWHEDDGAFYDTVENVASPYRGVYLLTVVCYRQTRNNFPPGSLPPADLLSAMVQVSDPVVVQLCDRKAR